MACMFSTFLWHTRDCSHRAMRAYHPFLWDLRLGWADMPILHEKRSPSRAGSASNISYPRPLCLKYEYGLPARTLLSFNALLPAAGLLIFSPRYFVIWPREQAARDRRP